ncbi:MAG: hypothetical protein ACT4QF_01240 [Sporichthyaceae bacterium]
MKVSIKPTAIAVAVAVGVVTFAAVAAPNEARAVEAAPSKPAVVKVTAKAKAVGRKANLTNNQVRNAKTIIAVVHKKKLPKRAAVIAVATAMQESSLRNLNYGDRDSLGLFQQRPSMGWGSESQVVDPQYSTSKFLSELQRVPRWKTRPLTVAAQKVQRSAYPNAYARWEPLAQGLVDAMLPKQHTAKASSKKKRAADSRKEEAPKHSRTLKAPACQARRGARPTKRGVSTRV